MRKLLLEKPRKLGEDVFKLVKKVLEPTYYSARFIQRMGYDVITIPTNNMYNFSLHIVITYHQGSLITTFVQDYNNVWFEVVKDDLIYGGCCTKKHTEYLTKSALESFESTVKELEELIVPALLKKFDGHEV